MKSGIWTTEFWLTLISTVVAFLVAIGVIATGDATVLSDALRQIVVAIFTLGGAAWVVINYIQSRTALKVKEMHELGVEIQDDHDDGLPTLDEDDEDN